MRRIVSIITALAVSLHLVLGCCAHHVHEHAQVDGNLACLHAHPCSHGHNHENPARPVLPPHDDCHDSHCAFLIASALKFSPDSAVAFLDAPADPTARELAPLRRVTPRDRGDPVELAVRPHLLHQSFLN